ncbi:MAG: hypothetical protein AUI54_04135 [Acidobacteria bacterium 13_1_40CM_2_56_5]|nr:MAG: hypothetical protein AUI54_04135 [Acidobacteria bacterium 13_1_40CM_2_56_5]
MAVTIRAADLNRDRDELVRFLAENLAPGAHASRFDWLYLEGPQGQARAWMAVDELGRTIGLAAAFPRDFWVGNRVEQVWVLGDFCIAKEHRSLGPALSLQRTCLESLDNGICYDFPSPSMLPIYRRLGVPTLGQHVRYVKLLKADEKILKFVRNRFLASPLIQIGNWTLALGRLSESIPDGVTFSLHEEECGEEFDAIDSSNTTGHSVRGLRNAKYLNWRYLRNPLREYRLITARRGSRLMGYAVVEVDGPYSMIADVRTIDPENTIPGLLACAEGCLRQMGVGHINAHLLEHCSLGPYLRRAGFYPRERVPVVAYTKDETRSLSGIHDSKTWFLLAGDRES